MIVDRAAGSLRHSVFSELPSFLSSRDCLVINRTLVVPAKFTGRRKTGGRVGGLFVREHAPGRWEVLLAGAGRLRVGEQITLGSGEVSMTLLVRGERGACEVQVTPAESATAILQVVGTAPLPPYIRRPPESPSEADRLDREYYQTVYAQTPGSIAAPTAGMHFTPELLTRIRSVGTDVAEVVLHVGLGTFQPVEVEDLADHPMHSERYELPQAAVDSILRARAGGGRIVAVGTTSVRVLETCGRGGSLGCQAGSTNLLIYPPYRFLFTDVLLTNFHLPGSTLLALACAFAGRDLLFRAYQAAIAERYRFYSYGDAMVII
jgi:S-adenosylmethionine:tRNA ribosyltransferase-isomerase